MKFKFGTVQLIKLHICNKNKLQFIWISNDFQAFLLSSQHVFFFCLIFFDELLLC